MKKIALILLVLFTLSGCRITSYYSGTYDLGLKEVYRNAGTKQCCGKAELDYIKEDGERKYVFEDDCIKATWVSLSTSFYFLMENKSDQSIKIMWDDAVYINLKNMCSRVRHSENNNVIAMRAKLFDVMYPADNFKNGSWDGEELEKISKEYIGKDVKILLPIQIQGVINEYTFCFRINDFIWKGNKPIEETGQPNENTGQPKEKIEQKKTEWYNDL